MFESQMLLVGCGNMGSALVRGLYAQGLIKNNLTVVSPHGHTLGDLNGCVHWLTKPEPRHYDVVIFAVKPQVVDSILGAYQIFAGPQTLFISVIAGKKIETFEKVLGATTSVVRAMPNTPSAIGRGLTVACANAFVTETQKALAKTLLLSIGTLHWLEDESKMNLAAALTSCGPAYVFQFIESLTQATHALGFEASLAEKLAIELVSGSIAYVESGGTSPADLRRAVTSPGGMTEAALKHLQHPETGLSDLLCRALMAASQRAEELGG